MKRQIATGLLSLVLAGWAGVIGWVTVQGTVHNYPETNPGAVISVGVLVAGVVLHALWYLQLVGVGRRGWLGGWPGAVVSYIAAFMAVPVLLLVAIATDRSLGG